MEVVGGDGVCGGGGVYSPFGGAAGVNTEPVVLVSVVPEGGICGGLPDLRLIISTIMASANSIMPIGRIFLRIWTGLNAVRVDGGESRSGAVVGMLEVVGMVKLIRFSVRLAGLGLAEAVGLVSIVGFVIFWV